MTPKLLNSLKYYTISVNESAETAEQMANRFETFFNSKNKWDQMEIALEIETLGYDTTFKKYEIN